MTNLPTPAHDPHDPQGHLNAIEAVWMSADSTIPRCTFCHEKRRVIPMSGNGWGVEVFHQLHCPEHEDNQPTPIRETQP